MVNEIQYTSIKRILDNLTEHPLLRDLTLEQVVKHTIRFIGLHGYPKLYQDKEDVVKIDAFRGTLPCDLIRITQVKDVKTGLCLRAMTDTFTHGLEVDKFPDPPKEPMHNARKHKPWYIPPAWRYLEEPAFKTQGRIIFTTFPKGAVCIAYKAIPVDDEGFPLLIDNEVYLAALEAYIKKMVFTVKFDTGKITAGVLQNAQADYAFLAGELSAEMTIPSTSEFEAISRSLTHLIPRVREFDRGFKHLGDREYLRKH